MCDLDLVLTLRTDEVGLFCEWADIANPDFKIYFSSGGGFDSRIALTAGMMALNGESVPPNIVVPAQMRQVTRERLQPGDSRRRAGIDARSRERPAGDVRLTAPHDPRSDSAPDRWRRSPARQQPARRGASCRWPVVATSSILVRFGLD